MDQPSKRHRLIYALLAIIIFALGGVLVYGRQKYEASLALVRAEMASSTAAFEVKIGELKTELETITADRDELVSNLTSEQQRARELEQQKEELDDRVDEFEKLAKIDPELLQKYSKIFFLNEHYTPAQLKEIPVEWLSVPTKPQQIQTKVWRRLSNLLEDAHDDGVELRILSAYRSFGEQTSLKAGYKVVYGSGANQFSADQGYSEHQLGTTVDFNTPVMATGLDGFQNTEAYKWLQDNAYRFGFVLSYPMGNTYYQFEPWHWRFVGRDLARDLHRENKNFYDLDQRDIDKYLIEFFD